MNGFTLLVLMAATTPGQYGQGDVQKDYGWQIDKDGKLEYILQISPRDLNDMTSRAQEKASSALPPEVAVRLSRVVVRIGDTPIQSSPMEEVLRIPL